jgi:hypothetical protein
MGVFIQHAAEPLGQDTRAQPEGAGNHFLEDSYKKAVQQIYKYQPQGNINGKVIKHSIGVWVKNSSLLRRVFT